MGKWCNRLFAFWHFVSETENNSFSFKCWLPIDSKISPHWLTLLPSSSHLPPVTTQNCFHFTKEPFWRSNVCCINWIGTLHYAFPQPNNQLVNLALIPRNFIRDQRKRSCQKLSASLHCPSAHSIDWLTCTNTVCSSK